MKIRIAKTKEGEFEIPKVINPDFNKSLGVQKTYYVGISLHILYREFFERPTKYTQSGLISTTVIFLVLVVLIFSQNFSTNGPYVVLNFCKLS